MQILPKSVLGGVYHAGVEIDGQEWSYGWTDDDQSGVVCCKPRHNFDFEYARTCACWLAACD